MNLTSQCHSNFVIDGSHEVHCKVANCSTHLSWSCLACVYRKGPWHLLCNLFQNRQPDSGWGKKLINQNLAQSHAFDTWSIEISVGNVSPPKVLPAMGIGIMLDGEIPPEFSTLFLENGVHDPPPKKKENNLLRDIFGGEIKQSWCKQKYCQNAGIRQPLKKSVDSSVSAKARDCAIPALFLQIPPWHFFRYVFP